MTEASRSGNAIFKCGCLPFLKEVESRFSPSRAPPTRLQITPQCWSVFSLGSFPAMPASTENLIWGQLLKNSYLLTQSIELFHHFCNFMSQLPLDVSKCIQIQMCFMFFRCWWFDRTAQYERERSSRLSYTHAYSIMLIFRYQQLPCLHCWLLFEKISRS